MRRSSLAPVAALGLAAGLLSSLPAHAGEIYTGLGLPGAGAGYAQPLGERLTLRGDIFTLGSRTRSVVENGIRYEADYKLQRSALLLDWFPFAGSFRLTGGATSNRYRIGLDASGAGGSLTIGDRTYVTTAADGLKVEVEFPKTTPYAGIGWGHRVGQGWRFSADIGAALGRATLGASVRGPLASAPDIQVNLDKELAELREGVGRIRAFPQVTLGIGYSF